MAKVLIISQRYFPGKGGAEHETQMLAEWCVRNGHQVDVWTSDALEADALWYPKREKIKELKDTINGVNVRRFKTSPLILNNVFFNKGFRYVMWHLPSWHLQCLGSPPTCIGMYLQLLKNPKNLPKYDIIHVAAMPYNSIFYVGMYMAKKLGAKFYMTPCAHSNITGQYVLEDKYFHPRVLPFYAAADKIIVHTDSERKALLNFFEQYKGLVSPNDVVKYGYDSFGVGVSREDSKISTTTPKILFILAKVFISIMSIPVFLSHLISRVFVKPVNKEINKEKFVKMGLGVHPEEVLVGDGMRFRKKYNLSPDQPVVIYIGAKEGVKGVYNLVNSSEILWKKGEDFKLVLAGNSSIAFEEFWETRSDLVKNNTIIMDRPTDADKLDALASATLFVMVSVSESFGIVYLEAWLYKIPVISSNIEVLREIIDEGEDGYLVPFDNSEELVDKMKYLLDNPDVRARMGQKGYTKVLETYTWEKQFKNIESMFNA